MALTQLLMTDLLLSPFASRVTSGPMFAAYSPYGDHRAPTGFTKVGFTGQLRELKPDIYLLGNGYRAYSPVLMRFLSPDRLSPFGAGGRNAYAYCQGNPVTFHDRSGRSFFSALSSVWNLISSHTANLLGSSAPAIGNVSAAIGSHFNPETTNPLRTVSGVAETTASVVATGAFFLGSDPVMNTANTIAGSISIANSGMNLASDISQPRANMNTISKDVVINIGHDQDSGEQRPLTQAYSRQNSGLSSTEANIMRQELEIANAKAAKWESRALAAEQRLSLVQQKTTMALERIRRS
ncbi:MAG: RHS repeat-associated core domain-containing protein [Paucimonas sp.]|nr:RHS repeat-associated core domain-containing protein [Paucimonas sp.]